jgi:hypothetical protein
LRRFLILTVLAAVLSASFLFVDGRPAGAALASTGVGFEDQNSWELVGRSDQNGAAVRHYGYLTFIHGLADNVLFSDPNVRTAQTARFTFFAETTLNSRHEVGNIITTAAPGTLTIFLNNAPAGSFDNPESFRQGTAIATFQIRYHSVLTVTGPNTGITSAVADLLQVRADLFTLGADQFRFGRGRVRYRATVSGPGTLTQVEPPRSVFFLGGNVVVTGR